MADTKISGLAAAGTLTGTELVPVVKSGVTSQSTTQDIADLASGTNLGSNDLTSTANERTFTLNGALSTNLLTIDNSGGTPIAKFRGDDAIEIPTGVIGIGTGAVNSSVNIKTVGNTYGFFSQGATTYGVWVSGSPTNAGRFETSKAGGVAGYFSTTGTSGSKFTVDVRSTGAGSNTSLRVNASGGSTNNAIYVTAGDINIGGSVGLSATYTFGGGGSGDIATMTYSKGILTGITTVP
ncbi:unnamed protein product [marine sediment metagenome]|uniref:Uncharacterized protein n=1 Tax=marine sediment metagenome TaxID=412755 RepID=X0YW43_9ZZZZ